VTFCWSVPIRETTAPSQNSGCSTFQKIQLNIFLRSIPDGNQPITIVKYFLGGSKKKVVATDIKQIEHSLVTSQNCCFVSHRDSKT
jgi:hypothetical protein